MTCEDARSYVDLTPQCVNLYTTSTSTLIGASSIAGAYNNLYGGNVVSLTAPYIG